MFFTHRKQWFILLSIGLLIVLSTTSAIANAPQGNNSIQLRPIGRFQSSQGAEIAAYDPTNRIVYVVSGGDMVEKVDISNPASPRLISAINIAHLGDGANSVAFHNGLLAVAIEAKEVGVRGKIAFYDANDTLRKTVTAGFLPDMVTFTPDGKTALVANEGEPSDDYTIDPVGSITVINLANGVGAATATELGFEQFNDSVDQLRAAGVRIFGPGASVAQDVEPEYIAVAPDSKSAVVTLQENNAIATVNLVSMTITDILPLGTKDHSVGSSQFDSSNKDDEINIQNWPTQGMYQPDAIDAYTTAGQTYYVTANEGDARDYWYDVDNEADCETEYDEDDGCLAYSEEARVKDLTLDPTAFPDAEALQANDRLGRLKTTTANGDIDGDGDHDVIYSYGTRSFSIWDANGQLVYDSGDDFEFITAQRYPADFNGNYDDETQRYERDERSDDKGAEPEAIEVGKINNRTYAFIGLERIGGILVYDITNPTQAEYVSYMRTNQDVAPEGLYFIPADQSPTGQPLLVAAHEVSNTLVTFQITVGNASSGSTTGDCVIPPSGVWPPCATGGKTMPKNNNDNCVIPQSGPWPPCATGNKTAPHPNNNNANSCPIPTSGPWPPCARNRL